MNKIPNILFFVFCTILVATMSGTILLHAKTPSKTDNTSQKKEVYPEIDDIVLGEANAPITLIEYSSINCTHCADFHKTTFKELKRKFIETAKVQYALKHFPLDFSAVEAMSIIAKQPKDTWLKHIETAFDTQKDWIGKDLKKLGKILNISAEDYTNALACEKTKTLVMAKRYNAEQIIDIDATPTFLILYRPNDKNGSDKKNDLDNKKEKALKHVLFNKGVSQEDLFKTLDKIYKEISSF